MKLEIPESLYFELAKAANEKGRSIAEHIGLMNQRYNDVEKSFEGFTQREVDYFTGVLFNTLDEILTSQEELARSDERTEADARMTEILNVLFGRATRDRDIFNEIIEMFFKSV